MSLLELNMVGKTCRNVATNVDICGFGPENQDISWETMISLKQWLCLLSEDYGKKQKPSEAHSLEWMKFTSLATTLRYTIFGQTMNNCFFLQMGPGILPTCLFTTKTRIFPTGMP